jgi:hypothetical protein
MIQLQREGKRVLFLLLIQLTIVAIITKSFVICYSRIFSSLNIIGIEIDYSQMVSKGKTRVATATAMEIISAV